MLNGWAVLAAAALFAGAAALLAKHFSWRIGAVAAWPALHFILAATGLLRSPLLPLAAVIVFAAAQRQPRHAAAGAIAAAAALLLVGGHWLRAGSPAAEQVVHVVLLTTVAAALARFPWSASAPTAADPAEPAEPRARASPGDPEPDDDVMLRALELIRRATDAHEATLWELDGSGRTASYRYHVMALDHPAPSAVVDLEGHPFGWAIGEKVPVHLQRGKRMLPSPWAAEMLLLPTGVPQGVVALAFAGVVPPGVEATALEAARHLESLQGLLAVRQGSGQAQLRMQALFDAVKTLPGELEMDRFAEQLAVVVRRGTGATGVAIALAPADGSEGRIVHLLAEEDAPRFTGGFGEADSRVALAIKHGVELSYDDLRRERERLPLCAPGETWSVPPRSAAVLPLTADGRPLGAVAVWHPEPARFGTHEVELLRMLCSMAPLPMRSATRYEALDRRASTDSMTGLPNRRTFEARLAAATALFERYNRPFGIIVADVDHFKKFNDSWGHEAGDRVLQHVAEILRGAVRDVDLAARLGGEEFVVLLPEAGVRACAEAAERIRRSIEAQAVVWQGRPLSVTVSLGVAGCPDSVSNPAETLAAADAALYRSKDAGRNRVTTAPRNPATPSVLA